jgi:ATP-dependent Clp protease ATP-binding subunit ClpA
MTESKLRLSTDLRLT